MAVQYLSAKFHYFKIETITDDSLNFSAALEVSSPYDFPVKILDASYSLKMNGNQMASGYIEFSAAVTKQKPQYLALRINSIRKMDDGFLEELKSTNFNALFNLTAQLTVKFIPTQPTPAGMASPYNHFQLRVAGECTKEVPIHGVRIVALRPT